MNETVVYPDLLWAGSQHSLDLAIQAHMRATSAAFITSPNNKDDDKPRLLNVTEDGVGIISIRGPLVSKGSAWDEFFGITSYAEIRKALIHAAEDPNIKGIMLDIDSGGGAVNGVSDTGDLIKTIDRKVKPVWAYTEGTMASAAYWLGASARQVYAAKTALTGSIGVILTHMEYSKMLEEEGVGVTVVRAGKYKALVNRVEPLTDVAKGQLQSQLNAAYSIFIGHVADARGVTADVADKRMGQGREFFGDEALEAGLVDGITSFDAVLSKFSTKLLDKSAVTHSNNGQYQRGEDMKRALTEAQVAALAAGAALPAVDAPEPTAAEVKPANETPAATGASETTAAPAAAATETPASTEAPAAAPTASNDGVVAYLQQQLASSQEQMLELRLQLKVANDSITAMKATHDGLLAIAAKSLSNMKVALGFPAVDATKLSAEAVLADHAATSDSFTKAFRAGGVAAVNAAPASESTQPVDPFHKRRLQASRLA